VKIPKTRYAQSGDVHIAYQVIGDAPVDLVYVPSFTVATFQRRLSSLGRLLVFDKRGLRAGARPPLASDARGRGAADGKVGGIAVHIGARVAAQAGPGEVLVSQTVKDLVAGAGIAFQEREIAELTGVPGEWRLFAVESA
jgi:class 3 adenylate cyclase